MSRLEPLLRKALPRAIAAEVAPLCVTALAAQEAQRHIARVVPPRRECDRVIAAGCADLDAAAAGEPTAWARFLARGHANTFVRARIACAWQALPEGAGFGEFVAQMRRSAINFRDAPTTRTPRSSRSTLTALQP
jgi:hypothetical protein